MSPIEDLYEQYFRDVYRYCCSLTDSRALAEDMAQETFEKAMKGIVRFKGECDVRTWLFRIAKNSYLSYCRKFNRVLPETEEELPDPTPSIEQRISDKETALQIHRLLHDLPEPYREVFHLRIFGELSFEQIGQIFGHTANWACVTFHRAKKTIQNRLEELQ